MLVLDAMFFLMALVLPLLLIWLAAWLADELARQREIVAALAELTAPLIGALGATRAALEAQAPVSPEAIGKAVQAAVLGGARPPIRRRSSTGCSPGRRGSSWRCRSSRRRGLRAGGGGRAGARAHAAGAAACRSRRPRRRACRSWPSRRRRTGWPGRIWCGRSTFRATPTMRRGSARCGWRSGTTGSRRCCRRPRTC